MSDYTPKEGDRVRVVLEGKVREVYESGIGFDIGEGTVINYILPSAAHVVSVEKLTDPIPTTVGTVLWIAERAWQRFPGGWWETATPDGLSPASDQGVQAKANRHGFTVLREGKP